MQTENKVPFIVLSLDGGGMRGLYTATILDCLATRFKEHRPPCKDGDEIDIGSGFDLIVGTSTGAILGTALALGTPIKRIVDFYKTVGPSIFTRPLPRGKWKTLFCWLPKSLFCAADRITPLVKALYTLFGKTTFKDLYERRKIALCITAVKMIDEKLRVFKTPHIPLKDLDNQMKLSDACRASSAAPLFLPLASVKITPDGNKQIFADGGLAANNPVLIGLIEALEILRVNNEQGRPIHIISIGTCSAPEGSSLGKKDLNRGILGWKGGTKALTLSMNAQSSCLDHSAKFLANWLTAAGQEVKIVRFPELKRSEADMQFLSMDRADENALRSFIAFGTEDAVEAFKLCQNKDSAEGKIIWDTFLKMNLIN